MLVKEEAKGWENFLRFVSKKCSRVEYENWIKPIDIVEFTDEEVRLSVPNIFVREYLMENYKRELASFLPVNEKDEPCVTFLVNEDETPKSPPVKKALKSYTCIKLNERYTFSRFIEGRSNQFAKSAAIGVATQPSKSYNPLFIHGGVGLGKTHLLHSIGHLALKKHKNLVLQCITTEQFINDLVENLRNKSVDKMKYFYRNLDVLLVDDIQFLQHRLNFEEEFCNTFESLINQNKQVIITSDKIPSELRLSERLTARMEWGLVANIESPDLETRVAILKDKAEKKGFQLPNDLAFFIAEKVYKNVRQLEGAINKISAYMNTLKCDITKSFISETLGEIFHKDDKSEIDINSILKSVGETFGVSTKEIKSSSRIKPIAFARQVAMYLAKELVSDSLVKIASAFGNRTHSTLIHSWSKIHKLISTDNTLKRQIDITRRIIKN